MQGDPFGWVGATVAGKFRVDAFVAEGGFGVVYRALHVGFDARVALKCLKLPARLQGPERDRFLEAFLAEGRLLHQLSRSTA
ncbi:MAG TPA: protein kinase, partial [Polyangiaceae bacterium]